MKKSDLHVGDLVEITWAKQTWNGMIVSDMLDSKIANEVESCFIVSIPGDLLKPNIFASSLEMLDFMAIHSCYIIRVIASIVTLT